MGMDTREQQIKTMTVYLLSQSREGRVYLGQEHKEPGFIALESREPPTRDRGSRRGGGGRGVEPQLWGLAIVMS